MGKNRQIVAWSAKLLSPNAEIVSRLNSVTLADRRLKCVPYTEIGREKSKSALRIGTGSSFCYHFGEKPKIRVFLTPVLPLPLAMQGRYWDRATLQRADKPRDATLCRETA